MHAGSDSKAGILNGYTVLDLTDEKGMLCGKYLASLGAEVIKVEPPGGDPARNLPPFIDDVPGEDNSLTYAAANTNKKSITLNIESEEGRNILRRLAGTCDFLIESYDPGYLDRLGLGYSDLSAINPRLIMTSITPFGQQGPYSHYKASDLMCVAMSGLMYLVGEPGKAPVRISVPQAYAMGSAEAFAGTMVAHYYRETTGVGQHVDTSIRDSLMKTAVLVIPEYERNGRIMKRGGAYWLIRNQPNRMLWACKDGYVMFRLAGSGFAGNSNLKLIRWMEEHNMADDFLLGIDWHNFDMDKVEPEVYRKFEIPVSEFFRKFTKAELLEEALKRGISLMPVSTIEDIMQSPQLAARQYWNSVRHPSWPKEVQFPGAFVKASETPLEPVRAHAPVGAHNAEIYGERLGLSAQEQERLKALNVI